jgi:sec-independent protein translocase protein TatA
MELFTPGHLIVVAIVALVLFFGWKQLPDMSRSLGRSLRIFKTEIKGMSDDDKARAEARDEGEPTPKALPAAEVVKKDVPANGTPANRPRPSPSPNGRTEPVAKAD